MNGIDAQNQNHICKNRTLYQENWRSRKAVFRWRDDTCVFTVVTDLDKIFSNLASHCIEVQGYRMT